MASSNRQVGGTRSYRYSEEMRSLMKPLKARPPTALPLALLAVFIIRPAIAEGFDRWTDTAYYEFEYRVDLGSVESNGGQSGRLWLPMPVDTRDQEVLSVVVDSPLPHREHRDSFGNRIATIDWIGKAPKSEIVFRYTVKRMPSSGIPASTSNGGPPVPSQPPARGS